ncbi:MAG: zinc dependent phospholipase C family protein, partial [Syntrophaceae bacterium]|nr:zinc dependent phospholipase C family protein [Syntrophaceae bacterium]
LPYLSLKTGTVNWADLMHYETTNGIVLHGYADIKNTWVEGPLRPTDERILAWLFGYASHLIADATIHPIVEAIVGPYEENSKEHQLCETTQYFPYKFLKNSCKTLTCLHKKRS